MDAIMEGLQVIVRTVDNRDVMRISASAVVDGDDFPVVWVCTQEEWDAARKAGRKPDAFPWPARDVKPVSDGQ